MSDDVQRDQHSKRRHKTDVKSKRQADIAIRHGLDVQSPHQFAKKHAMTCGNSNCAMCGNPRKFFKQETVQERRNKQDIN